MPLTMPRIGTGTPCPACGMTWRERTARFCGSCGTALSDTSAVAPPERRRWPPAVRGVTGRRYLLRATAGPAGTAQLINYGPADRPVLTVLDTADGTELWRHEDARTIWASDSALVLDSRASAGVGDLVAVDPRGGNELWRRTATTPLTYGWAESLLVADGNRVVRLDPVSGDALWVTPAPWDDDGQYRFAMPLDSELTLIGSRSQQGASALMAVSADSGEVAWQRSGEAGELAMPIGFQPTGRDLLLAVDEGGGPGLELVAMDPATGDTRWSTTIEARDVYAIRRTPSLLLVPGETHLMALDRTTGEVAWRLEGNRIQIVSTDPLVVTTGDGLVRLDPDAG